MIKDDEPINIFVAMPGTRNSIGGDSTPWPEPEDIKKFFFEKIAEKLKQDLKRRVILKIEKDKHLSGPIHDSMFAEAWQTSVYIADLTGNNSNVYLELGVRWALKDNITVVVSQNISSIQFNASYARAIPYNKDPRVLERAIEDVVEAIKEGIANSRHIDSPVRSKGNITAKSKEEIEAYENRISQLEKQIEQLKLEQGKNFIDIAQTTTRDEDKIDLYQRAIRINPSLFEAYLPLAELQRATGRYDDATITLEKAISLFSKHQAFYRELGVVSKKMGLIEQAIGNLREAVKLNDKDAEAWSNLGGSLRDLAVGKTPYNWDILREARNSYNNALTIDKHNVYALGNVARLDLLLSKIDAEHKAYALDELDTLELESRIVLKQDPTDYWRRFDLADSCLLSGKIDEGCHLYRQAIESVPETRRQSVLSSVITPLREFLSFDVLDTPIAVAVQQIIEDLNLAQSSTMVK